jgi:hypothetical protein
MSRTKFVSLAMLIVPILIIASSSGHAQTTYTIPSAAPSPNPLRVTGSLPTTALPPPNLNGPIQMQSVPLNEPQTPPHASVPPSASNQFEHHDDLLNLPRIFGHQWSLTSEVVPDNVISERYMQSQTPTARGLSLKEAIYIAIQNNPALKASQLDPIASMETVREANGTFDPNLTAQGDVEKSVVPVTSALQTGGGTSFVQKFYDWNFGLNKVSAVTNGTYGVTFNNDRSASNSLFSGVNPNYAPTLALSLSQPLLQNFGWQFATINVRIAESGQKQAQWTYGRRCRISCRKSAVITGTSCCRRRICRSRAPRCASISTWSARTRSASRSARWRRLICRKRNRPPLLQRPMCTPPRPT